MNIGNIQEFQQQQMSKVEKRKKEDEKIKKGIYQMQVMIDSQCMETFTKECEKNEKRTADTQSEEKETGKEQQESKKTDIQTELKKMIAATGNKALSIRI